MLAAREGAFRVVVWEGDHPPPHAHVKARGAEWQIALGNEGSAVALLNATANASKADTRIAVNMVKEHRERCLTLWRQLNG